MNNGSDYDFIIIGSGAGGGTLAYHLAPSGKKILLLERGPFVPREKENWSSLEVNARGRYNTKELWRNADGSELHPHTNYYVGGNTKFYGAALFRLREEDFGEIKHYGGISPAWPICTMSWSRITPRLNAFIMCTAKSAKIPLNRIAAADFRMPQSVTSRVFNN